MKDQKYEQLDILIVEDEIMFAMVLEENLRLVGCGNCYSVSSGEEAFEYVKKQSPNIVVMDLNLGGEWDGFETAVKINTIYKPAIIFVSGYNDEGSMRKAYELNATEFLVKPITPDHLLPIFDRVLGSLTS